MIEKFNLEFLIPGRRKLAEKINEIIDWIEINKRGSIGLGNVISRIHNRLDYLEENTIHKPDYKPEDVALRCIAEKGTFEWALIQMKKEKLVKRRSMFGCLSKNNLSCVVFRECDLLANDWEIVD